MTAPDDPSYRGFRVEVLHAWCQVDEDDMEGVIGVHTKDGWMPLVASDRVRLGDLKMFARMVAKQSGRPVVLKRFVMADDCEEVIHP